MNIGANLKQLRISIGKTQEEICKLCGFKQGNYTGWETNKYIPNAENLIRLADCFGCSVDYILGRESEDGTIIIENNNQPTLTTKEKTLLNYFRQMNEDTKDISIGILKGIING